MRADGVGQFSARYRAAWKALGRDEKDLPLIGLSRHVVVGDTDREAQSAAKRAFALWYDALIHLWRAHGVGLPRQMIPAEFEPALDGGYIIAGSASTVRDRLKRDNETAASTTACAGWPSATCRSRNPRARLSFWRRK